MRHFIVFTRGRTGSSAICDELDACRRVSCHQELFRVIEGDAVTQAAWREHGARCFEEPVRSRLGVPDRVLPLGLYRTTPQWTGQLGSYFAYLEDRARAEGSRVLGYKVLTRHVDDWESLDLLGWLARKGHKVVYLLRRDPVREAISGALARSRGFFSLREGEPAYAEKLEKLQRKWPVDCKSIVDEVEYIRYWADEWRRRLARARFECLEVYYEDFVNDRTAFLRSILDWLNLPDVTPPEGSSRYVKLVSGDLKTCIANYDELCEVLRKAGLRLSE